MRGACPRGCASGTEGGGLGWGAGARPGPRGESSGQREVAAVAGRRAGHRREGGAKRRAPLRASRGRLWRETPGPRGRDQGRCPPRTLAEAAGSSCREAAGPGTGVRGTQIRGARPGGEGGGLKTLSEGGVCGSGTAGTEAAKGATHRKRDRHSSGGAGRSGSRGLARGTGFAGAPGQLRSCPLPPAVACTCK